MTYLVNQPDTFSHTFFTLFHASENNFVNIAFISRFEKNFSIPFVSIPNCFRNPEKTPNIPSRIFGKPSHIFSVSSVKIPVKISRTPVSVSITPPTIVANPEIIFPSTVNTADAIIPSITARTEKNISTTFFIPLPS